MKPKRHASRTTGSTLRLQLDSVLQDVGYAIHGLLRRPGFTASVVLLLAVGIGANVAMFSALHQALLKPLPFAEPEDLVLARTIFNGDVNPDMSAPDCFDFRERNHVFESAGVVRSAPMFATGTGGEEPEVISTLVVSWDLFPTLGVPPAAGRLFSPPEGELGGPNVVMISGGYWQRRFGGAPDAVGSTITLDGTVQTIVGVMPPGFAFMHDVDLWLPLRRDDPTVHAGSRGWHSWFLVGRLRHGVKIGTARADLKLIAAQLESEYPGSNRNKDILVTELQEALTEDYQTTVFLLMAAVGLVLLIACGNVASLLLARGATRRSELSVRAALGASSGRLVRQLLTESLVTAAAGGALGVALAFYLQQLVVYAVPSDALGMESLGASWPMLAFALGVSAITGVLFGVLPASQAGRWKIADAVGSGTRSTDSREQRLQNGLVVTQVAVSTILLIGSGLLLKSVATLLAVEPGFDTENLMTGGIQIASDKYPDESQRILFFSSLQENLEAIPGVSDVAVVNQLPIKNPGNNYLVHATERPPDDLNDREGAFWRTILPGYFAAMGIPVLHGRGIEPSDRADAPHVVVINETMARKLFPDLDPSGRLVTVSQDDVPYEVVGVVGDVRNQGAKYSQRMTMYLPFVQHPTLTMHVAVRTAIDPVSLVAEMRDAVWKSDRDVPVTVLGAE